MIPSAPTPETNPSVLLWHSPPFTSPASVQDGEDDCEESAREPVSDGAEAERALQKMRSLVEVKGAYPISEAVSSVFTCPPAPLAKYPEILILISSLCDLKSILEENEEEPTLSPETDSCVSPPPAARTLVSWAAFSFDCERKSAMLSRSSCRCVLIKAL